jgi:hypothetical protein
MYAANHSHTYIQKIPNLFETKRPWDCIKFEVKTGTKAHAT